MTPLRSIWLFVFAGALAACATTPPAVTSRGASADLRLCNMQISNAPPANSSGHVSGFEPYTEISGVILSRAPVSACLSSGFGPRRGGASSFHYGVDLFTRAPGDVFAGGDGVVESVGSQRGYGKTIIIRHNDRVTTRYAHLSAYARGLSEGDRVRQGDFIGVTGNTGNATAVHLHYEIRVRGTAVDPLTAGR